MTVSLRSLAVLLAVATPAVIFVACGEDGNENPMEPEVGSVEVTTSTSGEDLDSDGYTVRVTSETVSYSDKVSHIGVNDSAAFEDIPPGMHEVELVGVADNCSVQGQNPISVEVVAGDPASVVLAVSCASLTGGVEVSASTTGADVDSTGYAVEVDGAATDTIDPNGSVTIDGLEGGAHTVGLADLAENCTVEGDSPRSVTVVADSTVDVGFSVACQAVTGDLVVATRTTGDSIDSDGYRVRVAGTDSSAIGVNDTVSFPGLEPDAYDVQLDGVAGNCSVGDSTVRTADIAVGDTVMVDYAVECHEAAGDLRVVTSTGGEDPDTTGYEVTVDSAKTRSVGSNDTVNFQALEARDHEVTLSEQTIAGNCTLGEGEENPRTVSIARDTTTEIRFEVDCESRVGAVVVTTATSGEDQDADGYTLTRRFGGDTAADPIGVADSVFLPELPEGGHEFELSGLASNCTVDGDNPRIVEVGYGDTASAAFAVTCESVSGDLQIFSRTTGDTVDDDGYQVTVDGVEKPLSPEGSVRFRDLREGTYEVRYSGVQANCRASRPAVDSLEVMAGTTVQDTLSVTCEAALLDRVVFSSFREGNYDLWSVGPDGAGLVRLTSHPAEDRWPSVSPDGTRLAWASERDSYRDDEILVRDFAEDTAVQITDVNGRDNEPAWSPDGERLVFVSERSDGDGDIWVMDADGSDARQLTTHPGYDAAPTWAETPTGEAIFFHSSRDGDTEIYRIDPDGSNLTQLTSNLAVEDRTPSVSPDGTQIVFGRGTSISAEEICVMDVDGSNLECLTDNSSGDANPEWSADGEQIVFESHRTGDWEIFVMNTDGTDQTNVTNHGSFDLGPTWTPPDEE